MTAWPPLVILLFMLSASLVALSIVVARQRAQLSGRGKPTGQEARRQRDQDRRQALLMATALGMVQIPIGIAGDASAAMIAARVGGGGGLVFLLGLAVMWLVRR